MVMQSFRNFGASRGWVVLVIVLVGAFAIWDISEYLGVRMGGAALTINQRDIPLREIDATYRNRMATITQMLGGTPPTPEMVEQLNVPQMVLTEVVHRNLLQQAAADLQLMPSERQLKDTITGSNMFKRGGRFDQALYKQLLGQQGLTPAAYENLIRDELALQQLAQLVNVAAPAPAALKPLLELEEAHYKVEVLTLPPALVTGQLGTVSDADLTAFYNANRDAYATPEKRSFEAIILNAESIGKSLTLPADDIAARYEENKATYVTPEHRHVRHILVPDAKQAVAAYNRIKAGDDFAKLAGELSQDPASKAKGGDLGLIAKDDVLPSFANAAFSLGLGEVSEPVQTSFGWHLIKVDSIQPGQQQTLEQMRPQLEAALRQEMSFNAMEDLLRTIDDKSADGSTLNEIAKASGLKVTSYALVPATTNTVDASLLHAAFLAEEGMVDGPVTMDNGDIAYLQVNHVAARAIPPLEDIRDRLSADFRAARQQTLLLQRAQAVAAAARTQGNIGTPLATVAQGTGAAGATAQTLSIATVTDAPEWLHPDLLKVFSLPVGGVLESTPRNGDNRMVVRLVAREIAPLDDTTARAAAEGYRQQVQQDVEQALLANLVAKARIRYNAPALRQVFGATWNPPQ